MITSLSDNHAYLQRLAHMKPAVMQDKQHYVRGENIIQWKLNGMLMKNFVQNMT